MRKKIILPVLLGATLLSSLLACNANKDNEVPIRGWSTLSAINANLGDTLVLPDVTFTEEETYKATKITTFPDGSEKMGDSIEITMSGEYTITYTVIVEGVVKNKVEKFFVEYPQLKVGNPSASSISYLENPQAEGILADKAGAYVKLAYGDTLSFTKPIYLEDLVSSNLLTKLYVVPSNMGSVDFSVLTLTLTNPDDPNNFVKIVYYSHIETNSNGAVSHSSSVCARSDAVNVFAGVHQSQGLHTNDKYGTWSGCTFDGYVQPSYGSEKIDDCMFSFGFDATTNQVYATGFGKGVAGDKVLDLDDPTQVRKVWGGFTGDRVLLSINCDSYSSTTANFVITEVLGVSASELKQNLFVDDEDPEISLVEDKEFPAGAVGYSYPIPAAKAYDKICLNLPVNVDVYQNYADEDNRIKVKVADNRFVMTNGGLYSIVYSAKDYAGNTSKLVKSISVLNTIKKPEFDLPSHESNADVGTYIKFDKNVNVVSYCGDASLKIYYKSASGEKILADDGFRITKLENYTVYYEASDMIGQTTVKSYQINVVNNNKPILENSLVLPRYFIAKAYYSVPSLKACLYENGALVYKDATFELTCDGTTTTYSEGDEYSPVIAKSGNTVNVKVKYQSEILTSIDVVTIKSTGKDGNENRLDLENYFIVKSGDFFLRPNTEKIVGDEERGAYLFSQSGEDIKMDFANSVLGYNFSITLNKILNAKAGTRVKVILTDEGDASNQISASFIYDGSNTYFEVGDSKVICLENLFNIDNEKNTFPLSFDGLSFTFNNDVSLPVFAREDGQPFTGLVNKNVFLTIEASSCKTSTSLIVGDLCGYIFKTGTIRDVTAPVIYMPQDIGGTKNVNEVYSTVAMYAYDVLSPNVNFTLSVKNAKDEYAKDVNGNDMNEVDASKSHDIVLSDFGAYTFKLTALEDTRFLRYPNTRTISRVVHVYDDVKPTIVMEEQFQSEVKVGTEIRFPKFTYSDNYDSKENLIVQRVYIDANGRYHNMTDKENSIKFSYVGVYKIMINVMDTNGNIANVTMYVNVIK